MCPQDPGLVLDCQAARPPRAVYHDNEVGDARNVPSLE